MLSLFPMLLWRGFSLGLFHLLYTPCVLGYISFLTPLPCLVSVYVFAGVRLTIESGLVGVAHIGITTWWKLPIATHVGHHPWWTNSCWGEGTSHKLYISNTKFLTEMESWISNTRHTCRRFNLYIHIIDLYWHMKFLLGRTLLDSHEHWPYILHSLEHLHFHMKFMYWQMEHIEEHLGIPPLARDNKDPIQVETIDSDSSA